MSENVFADEWRDCLRAHYIHVIRSQDRVTEPSLTIVMHQAGFSDTELAEFRVRATMHVDDVGADFEPDLDALRVEEHIPVEEVSFTMAVPEMPEAVLPEEVPVEDQLPVELEEVTLEDEAEEPEDEYIPDEPEDDPNAPQQLSLF